jgi:hypothetical protein
MISKARGPPSLIKIALMPWPKASHSTIKKIVNLGMAMLAQTILGLCGMQCDELDDEN